MVRAVLNNFLTAGQIIAMHIVRRVVSILLLLSFASRCLASGYQGDLGDAWERSSIVVMGKVRLVFDPNQTQQQCAKYVIHLEKVYKGTEAREEIEFLDPSFLSTASLPIVGGSKYLVFIQTRADRKRDHVSLKGPENIDFMLTGLRSFKVDDTNSKDVDAAVTLVKTFFDTKSPADRKTLLLGNLPRENAYAQGFVIREILQMRITEAIPHFRQKLAQAKDEAEKIDTVATLRCLGDDVRETLVAWLGEKPFTRKSQVIDELIRLNDKSVVPKIREHINAKDDYLAVTARVALLRLGEPDAKTLLLDMLGKSKDPVVRYNAIHAINWNYTGDFTDREKAALRELIHDKDAGVARVASFIVAKWNEQDVLCH